ncbi:MAG: divalent-cation tolerance protein CutA [Methanobacteriaceae archaeon]|nr:divalent-cation tolerance protein CutA [Methanobacteriaceae archaeon]MDP2836495.1 divalent-cation tolerance protein CutA [Methanobacteriaceae archaeon]MDP3035527.1 divalent-cation tolerance protein CutA [Methanobacteriaceae archaeon]MDP3484566.1 divalent-cation tolerance protein CutA [Methanobacteriaceae archaeon]MDP3622551.1 divalent-cation tolerance protein CutA [Methanobacteriaceae archaeon]
MFVLIYITTSSEEESSIIGNKLVEERLAACANIIHEIKSVYWWQGNLEKDLESVLIVKSLESKADNIIKRVKELHSYENPCIVALPIIKGSEEYLNWVKKEVEAENENNL